ncbi:hypothetical protein CFC21_038462 [Triticum aestivum]|uniref:F-box domain-containing protein n=2 Tax=Triticum aestivum TaxID=4565 RepID=A0A3B6ERM7_WHEAT|nr:hypothetical protein CFC21_038462 [Triticum aestivum]
MSTCKKARAESTSVVSSDRLSSLPPEIKGDILSRLNVEEAVRTSTLSSTWRDAWTNMPKTFLRDGNFARTKFVTLVDMVLSLHKGTVEKFDISGSKPYHDEFGSLPRVFQGFKRLTRLRLNNFSSTNMDMQNLVSFCPALRSLRLTYFEGINHLTVQAPKLKLLYVIGDVEINLDAPDLEVALLMHHKATAPHSDPIALHKESYVKQLLGSLSDIKSFAISGFLLRYLSKGCMLTKLPALFARLENIYLAICFLDRRQFLAACSLFQNAPNLKTLDVVPSHSSNTWDQDQARIKDFTVQVQLDHLVTASVQGFRGLACEVDFVAKLLSWAPALEELKIEWKGKTECSMVLAKLLALPRVSPRAKVIVTF